MKTFHRNDKCFRCPCHKCQVDPDSLGISEDLCVKLNAIQRHIYEEEMPVELKIIAARLCPPTETTHAAGLAVDILTAFHPELVYRLVDAAMVYNISFIEVCPAHVHLDIREIPAPKLVIGPDRR